MATDNEEQAFNDALIARTKAWREEKGWTADQMATALGIPAWRYRKYESRTPMPSYLMKRFCVITDATLENLVAGTPRPRANPARIASSRRA